MSDQRFHRGDSVESQSRERLAHNGGIAFKYQGKLDWANPDFAKAD